MRKIIRILFLTVTVLLGTGLSAQGYPVFDNMGLLAGIDRFYQGYDQLMNTITMIEQNYQQIEQAIKQAQSWSFEDLDFNDGNALVNIDIRDEIADATKQVDRQMNNIRKIRDTFEKENMTIGGLTFSMKDLAGLGDKDKTMDKIIKEAIETEKNDFKEGFKKIALGVTEEEAQAIWAKYGLSPQNFMMVKAVDKKMQEVSANVFAGASETVQKMQFEEISGRTNPVVKKLLEDPDSVTEKDIQQAEVLLGKLHGELLVNLQNALNQYAAYTAWKDRYEQTKKEAEEEDKRKTNEVLTQKDTGFECF